jgi:hypothetical protein
MRCEGQGAVNVSDGTVTLDVGTAVDTLKQELEAGGLTAASAVPSTDKQLVLLASDQLGKIRKAAHLLDVIGNWFPPLVVAIGAPSRKAASRAPVPRHGGEARRGGAAPHRVLIRPGLCARQAEQAGEGCAEGGAGQGSAATVGEQHAGGEPVRSVAGASCVRPGSARRVRDLSPHRSP